MSEPAKLNPQFTREPVIRLEDLKPGESGWVDWLEMAIDSEYRAYIDPRATVASDTYCKIHVTRSEAGFEVLIPVNTTPHLRELFHWRRGLYNPKANEAYARYLPVVKLEYEEKEGEK
jgi:hypothetical protein